MRRALALAVLAACSAPGHDSKDSTMTNTSSPTNGDLVAQVRAAVTAHVPVDLLEARIREKPIVDTTKGFKLDQLKRVNFVEDPDHPDEQLALANARAIIYWDRHVAGDSNPHVVGVQQRSDGTTAIFFSVILPP
ncbi:MAG TPA: hypothetical protein VH143_05240 [Kofleriaceae bacterium]|jgi:hypothetical protein|nr:hypothetical protein [Kofleriaceae bacterium]